MTRRTRSRRKTANNSKNQKGKSNSSSSPSSSDTDRQEAINLAKAIEESKIEMAKNRVVSDRERRMRKRQQSLEYDAVASDISANGGGNTSARGGNRVTSNKKAKTGDGDESDTVEEVVKVKLNTGMLYIYRGSRPRVEFVRRY